MSPQELQTHHGDRGLLGGILARFGARHIYIAAALAVVITAILIPSVKFEPLLPAPLSKWAEDHLRRTPRQELPLEIKLTPSGETEWHEQSYTIRSGETLASLFHRAGIQPTVLHQIMQNAQAARNLRSIHPGRELQLGTNDAGQLQTLSYEQDALSTVHVQRTADNDFEVKVIEKPIITRRQFANATITSSLFASGEKAGMSDAMVMDLASVFGYDIDFAQDLRKGDHFSVVYDEKLVDGIPVGSGTILAAEFVNQGTSYKAVRYLDKDGNPGYYAPDGKSLRKAFLRAPLQFSRISSNFSLSRMHPILNTIRAHKGTDYAAPSGTPVYAAGDGRVIFAGLRGGYGRLIALQHGNQVETHYAHLSAYAKGVQSGTHVHQGQVIGYVGQSGLATAPHLHYEFLVNGAFRDPRTVPLPKAEPINANERERFLASTGEAVMQLQNQTRLVLAQAR